VEYAINRYVNDDIAWCGTFAGNTLDVLDELWTHEIFEVEGDYILGFYAGADDRIAINDETNLQYRARTAVHEGFHRWIGDDHYEGEEEDAHWWGNYCTGLGGSN